MCSLRRDGICVRVEKVARNKLRIFISYDDLEARGIDRDEMWQNGKKVQELFWDMLEVAYAEVGFEIAGPIAVEAFTMPTEGVVLIVTQVPSLPPVAGDQDEENTLKRDPFGSFVFSFEDFEDVVRVVPPLSYLFPVDCSLYYYNDKYHLSFDDETIPESHYDLVWAVLQEHGELAPVTSALLEEYGKCIADGNALEVINRHFV